MVYLFFDVDGVLNKESDWEHKFYVNEACVGVFAEICLRLKKIYGEVRLVIVSTWRVGISQNGDNTIQMQYLEKALKRHGLYIHGQTPVSNKSRQDEISYYIRRNFVNDYMVIDDDESLYNDLRCINIYIPNYKTGLTKKDIRPAVKVARHGGVTYG